MVEIHARVVLGVEKVSFSERCPQFRGVLLERYSQLNIMYAISIHTHLPEVSLSSDFIAGFCGETEEEHRDTISLMERVKFDMAYMFSYSMRKVSCSYSHNCDT